MPIIYLKKACAWALFLLIALVSTHAVASTQGQVFSGEPEKVKPFAPEDTRLFAKLGDFIAPNNVGVTILSIELGNLSDTHARGVKSVFLAYAPEDFYKAHRQISTGNPYERIFLSKASGPTIITIASDAEYHLSPLIKKHPDVVIITSAGNDSESKPDNAIGRYKKYIGINIFYGGGTKADSDNLHYESTKPGKYGYAYIADPYRSYTLEGSRTSGTSFAIQITAAKLAMLYTALNVNGEWSMVDAMQLLMTTRKNVEKGHYKSDLTKLLVRNGNGKFLDDNGKAHLLPEATLREMLSTSPLYRN